MISQKLYPQSMNLQMFTLLENLEAALKWSYNNWVPSEKAA